MSKIITLAPAGELAMPLESALSKLPTDAVHNHLHQVAERAKDARTNLEGVELSALILCAVELEEIKGKPERRNGLPWKDWVAANCDFSHMTVTKYARVLKAGREGLIGGLDPEAIPDIAPSDMSGDQLKDACATLAKSLQGLGGIRQLYLKLEIIALPSKTIAENRNLEGGAKKPTSTGTAQGDLDLETRDAIASYRKAIADLDRAVQLDKHVALPGDTRAEIIDALTHHIETLNSL
jgi:hypothetical protein